MSEHTATPWRVETYRNTNPANSGIFPFTYEIWPEVTVLDQTAIVVKKLGVLSEANARFIARAANNHGALLKLGKGLAALACDLISDIPKDTWERIGLNVTEQLQVAEAIIAAAEKE